MSSLIVNSMISITVHLPCEVVTEDVIFFQLI